MLTKEESVFSSIGVRQKKLLPRQNVQLEAVYYDQYGRETFPRGHEVWEKRDAQPADTAVEVSQGGFVTFGGKFDTTSLTVQVEAAKIKSGDVTIPVSSDPKMPTSVEVKLAEGSSVPVRVNGKDAQQISFTATVYDQYSEAYTPEDLAIGKVQIRWSVQHAPVGTVIDPATGTVTVPATAEEIPDVRVVATCWVDDAQTEASGYHEFAVVREAARLSGVEIVESGFPAGEQKGLLTLRYLDQFGGEMNRPSTAAATWETTTPGVILTKQENQNAEIVFVSATSAHVKVSVLPDAGTAVPLTDEADITLGTERYLSKIVVTPHPVGGVRVPDIANSDSPSTKAFTAQGYDQYGAEIDTHLIWSLGDKDSAISISQTGILTVRSGAPEMKMTVYATDSDTGVYGTYEVDIIRDPSVFTYLEVKQKALPNDKQSMVLEPVWLDQYKKEMSRQGSVSWKLVKHDGYMTGIKNNSDGYTATLEPLDPTTTWVVVEATCRGVSTGEVLLQRTDKDEYVAKVEIARTGATGAIVVPPKASAQKETASYQAHVYNQYGDEMTGREVTWEVESSTGGVSIDQNGVVSVSSAAYSEEVRVIAREKESGKSGTATLVIKRASPEFTSAAIKNDYIPRAQNPFTLTAVALDQYGEEMAGYDKVEWTLPDGADGDTYFASPESGTLHFKASLNTVKVQAKVTVGTMSPVATKEIPLSDEAPELREIKVTRTDGFGILYIPYGNQPSAHADYTAVGIDQYLQPMQGLQVNWELRGAPKGVTFPDAAGAAQNQLSVAPNTAPGSIQIVATELNDGKQNKISGRTIQILDRSPSELKNIEVRENSLPYGTEVVQLHADYFDQYETPIDYKGVSEWYVPQTEPESLLNEVSITPHGGLLTLTKDVQAVYVRVSASGTMSRTKRIVIGGDPHTARVEITKDPDGRVVSVPSYDGEIAKNNTYQFTATSYDQYGSETEGKFGWYLDNAPEGISITQGGLFTVTSDAPEKTQVRVVAVDLLSGVEGEYIIDLVHGIPQESRANIKEDEIEGEKTTQLTAQMLDQFGEPMSFTDRPVWSCENDGGTVIDAEGRITPKKGAASVTVTLVLGDKSTTKTLRVGGKRVLDRIEVTGSTEIALVPGAEPQPERYTAVGYDQYGNEFSAVFTWKLEGAPEGMAINASTGRVTVRQDVVATRNIKVVAVSEAAGISGSLMVDLTYADSVLSAIGVRETGVPGGKRSFTLTPVFYDQYGKEIEHSGPVFWEVVGSHPQNSVTVNESGVFEILRDDVTEVTVRVTAVGETIAPAVVALPVGGGERQATTVEVTRKGPDGDVIIPGLYDSAFAVFQAKVFDQYHQEMTGSFFWNISGNPAGVSISSGGVVSVDSSAQEGTIEIVAVDSLSNVRGVAYLTLRKADRKLSFINVLTEKVPADTRTGTLLAEYKDQYGEAIDYKGASIWVMAESSSDKTTLKGDQLYIDDRDGYAVVYVTAKGVTSPTAKITVGDESSDALVSVGMSGLETVYAPLPGDPAKTADYPVKAYTAAGDEKTGIAVNYTVTGLPADCGISFDTATGKLTVTDEAAALAKLPLQMEITATHNTGGKTLSDAKNVTVVREMPALKNIVIQPEGTDPAKIPSDAKDLQLTAKFYDQYDQEMVYGGVCQWNLENAVPAGTVKLTSDGKVTVKDTTVEFTVQVATVSNKKVIASPVKTFQVGQAQSLSSIKVEEATGLKDGFTVEVPSYQGGKEQYEAKQFVAKAYDQYGFEMELGAPFIWELDPTISGISVNQGGRVLISSSAPKNRTVTVKASSNTGIVSGTAWFVTDYESDNAFAGVRVDTLAVPFDDGTFRLKASAIDEHGQVLGDSVTLNNGYDFRWELLDYPDSVKENPPILVENSGWLSWTKVPAEGKPAMQVGDTVLVRVWAKPAGAGDEAFRESKPAAIRLGGEAKAVRLEIVPDTGIDPDVAVTENGISVTVPEAKHGSAAKSAWVTVEAYDQYGRKLDGAGNPWAETYKKDFIWSYSDNNEQTVSLKTAAGEDQRTATIQVETGAPKKDHINVGVQLSIVDKVHEDGKNEVRDLYASIELSVRHKDSKLSGISVREKYLRQIVHPGLELTPLFYDQYGDRMPSPAIGVGTYHWNISEDGDGKERVTPEGSVVIADPSRGALTLDGTEEEVYIDVAYDDDTDGIHLSEQNHRITFGDDEKPYKIELNRVGGDPVLVPEPVNGQDQTTLVSYTTTVVNQFDEELDSSNIIWQMSPANLEGVTLNTAGNTAAFVITSKAPGNYQEVTITATERESGLAKSDVVTLVRKPSVLKSVRVKDRQVPPEENFQLSYEVVDQYNTVFDYLPQNPPVWTLVDKGEDAVLTSDGKLTMNRSEKVVVKVEVDGIVSPDQTLTLGQRAYLDTMKITGAEQIEVWGDKGILIDHEKEKTEKEYICYGFDQYGRPWNDVGEPVWEAHSNYITDLTIERQEKKDHAILTVPKGAVEGTFITIEATTPTTRYDNDGNPVEGTVIGSLVAETVYEKSYAAKVEINEIGFPADTQDGQLTLTYYDQYGNIIAEPAGAKFTWSSVPAGHVDDKGLFHFGPDNSPVDVTVKVVYTNHEGKEIELTDDANLVAGDAARADHIKVSRLNGKVNAIQIPDVNPFYEAMTAKLYDQYNRLYTDPVFGTEQYYWSLENISDSTVSINYETGMVIVTAQARPEMVQVKAVGRNTGLYDDTFWLKLDRPDSADLLLDHVKITSRQMPPDDGAMPMQLAYYNLENKQIEKPEQATVEWSIDQSKTEPAGANPSIDRSSGLLARNGATSITVKAVVTDPEQKDDIGNARTFEDIVTLTVGAEAKFSKIAVTLEDEAGNEVTEQAVPKQGEPDAAIYAKAQPLDQYGRKWDKTENIIFTIDPPADGVSVGQDSGKVAVNSLTAGGTVTVKASSKDGVARPGTASFKALREESELKQVEILLTQKEDDYYLLPKEAATTGVLLNARYIDQYGKEMAAPKEAAWSVALESGAAASIDAKTGLLKMDGTATVTLDSGKPGISDTKKVKVTDIAAKVDSITVRRTDGEGNIMVPAGSGRSSASFAATVLDQFGTIMKNEAVKWLLPDNYDGITIDPAVGTVLVTKEAPAKNGIRVVAMHQSGVNGSTTFNTVHGKSVLDRIQIAPIQFEFAPGADVTTQLRAICYDQYGTVMEDPGILYWEKLDSNPQGTAEAPTVTLSTDGLLTPLIDTLETVDVQVTVRDYDTGYDIKSSEVTRLKVGLPPRLAALRVTADKNYIDVPAKVEDKSSGVTEIRDGEEKLNLTVTPVDQYGNEYTAYTGDFSWQVKTPIDGVTVVGDAADKNHGIVTVTSGAPQETDIEIEVSAEGNTKGTLFFDTYRSDPKKWYLTVKEDGAVLPPQDGQLTAVYRDQYGDLFEQETPANCLWTLYSVTPDSSIEMANKTENPAKFTYKGAKSLSVHVTDGEKTSPISTMTFGDTTERYLTTLVLEKQPADQVVAVPEPGKADNQFSYVVKKYLDQYGDEYPVEGTPEISWKLNGSHPGVTMDENTGVVTVTSAAADAVTIEVTATETKSGAFGTAKFVTKRRPSEFTSLEVREDAIPAGDLKPTLTAKYLDQYGTEMNYEAASPRWTLDSSVPEGATIGETTGQLNLSSETTSVTVLVKDAGTGKISPKKTLPVGLDPYVARVEVKRIDGTGDIIVPAIGTLAISKEAVFSATFYDQYGTSWTPEADEVVWTLNGAGAGVSVAPDQGENGKGRGVVTVEPGAESVTGIKVTATARENGVSSYDLLTVRREARKITSIAIKNSSLPVVTGENNTVTLKAIAQDQYGSEMEGRTFLWTLGKITPAGDHAAVSSDQLTYDKQLKDVEVTVEDRESGLKISKTLSVKDLGEPVPAEISVKRVSGSAVMSIPTLQQGTATVQFQASVYDQYGQEMSGQQCDWSIEDILDKTSITVDNAGLVTITPKAPVQNVIKVRAAIGSVYGEASFATSKEESVLTSTGLLQEKVRPGTATQLTALYYDQYGQEMVYLGTPVWKNIYTSNIMVTNEEGKQVVLGELISLDENTGLLTIEPISPEDLKDDKAKIQVSITAEGATGTGWLTIVEEGEPELTTVKVDQIGGAAAVIGPAVASYKAEGYDQYGSLYPMDEVWSLEGSPRDSAINQNGVVTVGAEEAPDTYKVVAADRNTRKSGSADLMVITNMPKLKDIILSPSALNPTKSSITLSAVAIDQYGNPMSGLGTPIYSVITWEGGSASQVYVAGDVLHYDRENTTSVTVEVVIGGTTVRKTLTKGDLPRIASIALSADSNQLIIPAKGEQPAVSKITATVLDQYGEVVTAPYQNTYWSLSGAGKGITLEENPDKDGTAVLSVESGAESGSEVIVTLTQAETSITGKTKIKVEAAPSILTTLGIAPQAVKNGQGRLHTVYFDQYGKEMPKPAEVTGVTWSLGDFDANGSTPVLTPAGDETDLTMNGCEYADVKAQAAMGGNTLEAAARITSEQEENSRSESITVTRVSGSGNVEILPSAPVTVTYKATVLDQFGQEIKPALTWSLTGAPSGVSIDRNTGVVTVGANAEPADGIRVTAMDISTGKYGEAVLNLVRGESYAISVQITTQQAQDKAVTQLAAQYKDQYGQPVAAPATAVWSLVGTPDKAVLFSDGRLDLTAGYEADSIDVQVSYGSACQDTKTLAVVHEDDPNYKNVLTDVKVFHLGDGSVTLNNTGDTTAEFGYTAYDQYGNVMLPGESDSVTWKLTGKAPDNYSIPDTKVGAIVAAEGAKPQNQVGIEGTVRIGTAKSGTAAVDFVEEEPRLAYAEVLSAKVPRKAVQLTAKYLDQFGNAAATPANVRWTLTGQKPEGAGAYLTADGILYPGPTATEVTVMVTADGVDSAEKAIPVIDDLEQKVDRVEVYQIYGSSTVAVPKQSETPPTLIYGARILDEYSNIILDRGCDWQIENMPTGVEIQKTQQTQSSVTVQSSAAAGTVTVMATEPKSAKSGTASLTLTKESSVVNTVEIRNDMVAPQSTTELELVWKDQYGMEMDVSGSSVISQWNVDSFELRSAAEDAVKPSFANGGDNDSMLSSGDAAKITVSVDAEMNDTSYHASKTILVGDEPAKASYLSVTGPDEVQLSSTKDTIANFTSIVRDQYGGKLAFAAGTYSWKTEVGSITTNGKNGVQVTYAAKTPSTEDVVQVTLATGTGSSPITGKKQVTLRQETPVLSRIEITSKALPAKENGDLSMTLGVKYLDQNGEPMPAPADALWSIDAQQGTPPEGVDTPREAAFRTESDARNGVLWVPTDVDSVTVKVAAGGQSATANLARDSSYLLPEEAVELNVTRLKGSGAIYIPVSGQDRYGFGAQLLDAHGNVVTPAAESPVTWKTVPAVNGAGMTASEEDATVGILTVSNNAAPKNGVKVTASYKSLSDDVEVNLVRKASELAGITLEAGDTDNGVIQLVVNYIDQYGAKMDKPDGIIPLFQITGKTMDDAASAPVDPMVSSSGLLTFQDALEVTVKAVTSDGRFEDSKTFDREQAQPDLTPVVTVTRVLKPGEVDGPVTVPTGNTPVKLTFQAESKNIDSPSFLWSLDGASSDVTCTVDSTTGKLTVTVPRTAKAAPVVTVTAQESGTKVSGTASFSILRQESKLTDVAVRPVQIAPDKTSVVLSAVGLDQYGEEMELPENYAIAVDLENLTTLPELTEEQKAALTYDESTRTLGEIPAETQIIKFPATVTFTDATGKERTFEKEVTITRGEAPRISEIKVTGPSRGLIQATEAISLTGFDAKAYDQYGDEIEMPASAKWELFGAPAGVTFEIDEAGVVTVQVPAKAKEASGVTLRLCDYASGVSGSQKFDLVRDYSAGVQLTSVGIQESAVRRGADTTLTPQYFDQFDEEIAGYIPLGDSWKIEAPESGVAIDEQGKLTITDDTLTGFTVTYTADEKSVTKSITISGETPVPAGITVTRNTGSGPVMIPVSGKTNVAYTAEVLDQYSRPITSGLDLVWGVENAPASVAASGSGRNGMFTVDSAALEAKDIRITVADRGSGVSGSATVDIAREDSVCFGIKIDPTVVPYMSINYQMKVKYLDQYGNEMAQPAHTAPVWTMLSEVPEYVTLTSDGKVSTFAWGGQFRVRAALSEFIQDEAEITTSDHKIEEEQLSEVVLRAQSPVTVSPTADQQVQVYSRVFGEFGTEFTDTEGLILTWNGTDENGVLTVPQNSESKTYQISAEAALAGAGTASGDVSVYASHAYPQPTTVKILTRAVSRKAPHLVAEVLDQYGEKITGAEIQWALSEAVEGVTVAENGVTSIAEGVEKFSVTASSGEATPDTQEITVSDEEPVPTEIIITRLDVKGSDAITAPGTAQYSAEVKDQFGGRVDVKNMVWAIDPYVIGVDVDRNGNVTVYDTAATGPAVLTVSAAGLEAEKTLSITGKEYSAIAGLEIMPNSVPEGTETVELKASFLDSYGSYMGSADETVKYGEPAALAPEGAAPSMEGHTLTMGGATSVKVTGSAQKDGKYCTGEQTINVVEEGTPSEVTWIHVEAVEGVTDGTMIVPLMKDADTPGTETAKFKATPYDQYGQPMESGIVWSIQSRPKGVSIDQNGVLTLTSEAVSGRYLVEATAANGISGTYTLEVKRELTEDQLTFTFLKVEDVVLKSSETQGDLKMKFLDQYGDETAAPAFTGEADTWTLEAAKPDGTIGSVTLTPSGDYQSVTVAMGSAKLAVVKASITVDGTEYTASGSIGYPSESIPAEAGLDFKITNENGATPDTITYWQKHPEVENALQEGDVVRVYARGDSENSFKLVGQFTHEPLLNATAELLSKLQSYLPVEGGVAYITRQGDGMESEPYPITMDKPFGAETQTYIADYLQITQGAGSAPQNPLTVAPGADFESVKAQFPGVIKVVSSTGNALTFGAVGSEYYVMGAGDVATKIDKTYIDTLWSQSYNSGRWKTDHKISIVLPEVVDKEGQAVISQPVGKTYTAYFYIREGDKAATGTVVTRIEEPRTLNLTAGMVSAEQTLLDLVADLDEPGYQYYLGESETPEEGFLKRMTALPEAPADQDFVGWTLGEQTAEGKWQPMAALQDTTLEQDDRDALIAEALANRENSGKLALIACPDYATPGYTVNAENYPYIAVPINLYSVEENPLQLTEGNNDVWKSLKPDSEASDAAKTAAQKYLDNLNAELGEDAQRDAASFKDELVFYYKIEGNKNEETLLEQNGNKEYVEKYTNPYLLEDGTEGTEADYSRLIESIAGTAIGDVLAGNEDAEITITEKVLGDDGYGTQRAALVDGHIQPNTGDSLTNYYDSSAATSSVVRGTEYYQIEYKVKVGTSVYVATRNVKLGYRTGDVDLDSNINGVDAGFVTAYVNRAFNAFCDEKGEAIASLYRTVMDIDLDTNANGVDAGFITAYVNRTYDIPPMRF